MVNKKKKNRQQGQDDQNASDSTESCDENQIDNSGGKCPHVLKAVDFTRVKKSLKSSGIARECMDCSKCTITEPSNPADKLEVSPGLWLCLQCGHQSCGRDRNQHALKHHETPRSDSHAIVVNTELWNVWCYDCNFEIPSACKKKLHECLEFIKRQEDAPAKAKKPASNVSKDKNDVGEKNISNAIVQLPVSSKSGAVPKDLPRVRGLRNNGNTCFFNAVLQCLAHTPFLLHVLQETKEPGEKFMLPGTHKEDIEDIDSDDEGKNATGDDDETYVPPIYGELGKWGSLTETLATTLAELQSSNSDVYNPDLLMKKLMQRCPLFEGNDQHDSQELLRHLLEGVRSEDLKRYQISILHKLGLTEKVSPSAVDEPRRYKAKIYGRQASELSLRPDQVFRGSLVSTLECQDCKHASQRAETFLDLSLPVMADKPQPPVVMRRKSSEESVVDFCGKSNNNQPSKHQLKKEKKLARKGKKRQGSKGRISESGESVDQTIVEDAAEANGSGESEESDADVEDNVEQDAVPGKQIRDVGESGYSSEKAANEDSAVESPVMNGDSAFASPASPALPDDLNSPIPLHCKTSTPHLKLHLAQEVQAMSDTEEVLFEISDLPQRPTASPVDCNEINLMTPVRAPQSERLQYATLSNINFHDNINSEMNGDVAAAITNDKELHIEIIERADELSVRMPQDDQLDFRSANVSIAEEALSLIPSTVSTREELAISIPMSLPLLGHSVANKESPLSNQGSVSGASSEINLEMASPSSAGHGEPSSPTFSHAVDFDRPISRFAFVGDEALSNNHARCSPADEMCSSGQTWLMHDEVVSSLNEQLNNKVPEIGLDLGMQNLSLGGKRSDFIDTGASYSDEIRSSAQSWPIHDDISPSANEQLDKKTPVNGQDLGMQKLSLSLEGKLSDLQNDDILAGISEEEVHHLIKELSKEKLNVSEEEPKMGEICEVLKRVSLAEESDGVVDGLVYGPFLNENVYPETSVKSETISVLDASPTKDKKRPEYTGWSATLVPKYTTDDGECSVMSCLNQFTAIELMTGNNKVGCESCTKKQNQGKEGKMVTTNSTKQFLLSSPPPVLILHLKRFQLQRSLLKKMSRHVAFPRLLDLAPLISTKSKDSATVLSGQRQVLYSVYGVVEHSGTLQYGHYIAYVKVRAPVTPDNPRWRFLYPDKASKGVPEELGNVESDLEQNSIVEPPPGKWYCVSDSRVNEVSEDKVMRSEAYLLFYERIW